MAGKRSSSCLVVESLDQNSVNSIDPPGVAGLLLFDHKLVVSPKFFGEEGMGIGASFCLIRVDQVEILIGQVESKKQIWFDDNFVLKVGIGDALGGWFCLHVLELVLTGVPAT